MKFKVFEAQSANALSMQVNKWLDETPGIQIVSATQSERPTNHMLVVMLFYFIAAPR